MTTNEVPIETLINEWENLINELSHKEVELLKLKYTIFDKEQWIVENTDFKQVYGKNNSDVRKLHFQKHMKQEYDLRDDLEISIDYLKRRISFLKTVLYLKKDVM